MLDHQVLNLFNTLSISSVRLEIGEGWCCVRFKNSIRNLVLPVLLGVLASFVGISIIVSNWRYFIEQVAPLSSVLRYSAITYVNIATNIFFFLRRKRCAVLVEKLLHFDQCFCIMTNTQTIQTAAKFTKMQIAFAVVIYMTIMLSYIAIFIFFEYGHYGKILLTCCIFIGIHFALQQLYTVFFAEHLTIRYRLIRAMIQMDAGHRQLLKALKLHDQLVDMQKLISEIFGLYCVMCSLVVFLNSAIAIYGGIIMLDQELQLAVALVESSNTVPIIVSFYGMTYMFDVLIQEEEEFKNTIIAFQYNSFEEHSEDLLNFLDQINLKLMTESPKITACGLFTMNLQVLNNVFAAIVIYIVILFQFRGFESL